MKIAVIDIETTDFFKNTKSSIIEVGIAILDTENATINKAFSSLCKEQHFNLIDDKNAWIFSNSDLTVETFKSNNIPTFNSIKKEIQTILDSVDCVTSYNKAFDFEFLKDRGIKIKNEYDCIMLLMTPICKIPKPFYQKKYNLNDPYKWPSCEEAWKYWFPNIEYKEKHRALDDAIHESLILWKIINLNS